MREKLNDIVAGILLIVGLVMIVLGLALHFSGAPVPTRTIIAAGGFLVVGVFLYAQIRETDDGN